MVGIHQKCVEFGKESGAYVDYVKGANIAGFVRVVDAMLDLVKGETGRIATTGSLASGIWVGLIFTVSTRAEVPSRSAMGRIPEGHFTFI